MGPQPQQSRYQKRYSRTSIKETSIDDILAEAESTDFKDEKSWKPFEEKHLARLTKDAESESSEHEVLHVLAEKYKPLGKHKNFLEWAIKTHTQLLECSSRLGRGETPLHRAIRANNHEFVQLVLDNVKAEVLFQHSTDLDESCLHFAIKFCSPFTESIISLASEVSNNATNQNIVDAINSSRSYKNLHGRLADDEFDIFKEKSNERDYKGMTPLHMALCTYDAEPDTNSIKAALGMS
jgi:hypothetical protein